MYGNLCSEYYDNDKPLGSDNDEVIFYKQFFTKNQLLLEPMCGSGRILIPMLEAGFKVHGLDNSPHMLANCKERLRQRNLQTEIFKGAVTELDLPQKYDGIFIAFASFQLLYPRAVAYKALDKLHQHLNSGGNLILEMFIPWEAMHLGNEEEIGEKQTILPDGSIIINRFRAIPNKYEQYYILHDAYEKIVAGKVTAAEEESMYLSWYFLQELELILEKHGFSNISTIKRVNKKTYKEEIKETITYVAQKL